MPKGRAILERPRQHSNTVKPTPRPNPEAKARSLANLRPGWMPGKSGNPGGKPRVLREILELGYSNSPAIFQRLIDAALHDPNPNVWIPAADKVLTRVFGKPKEQVEARIEHAFVLRAPAVMDSADEWEAKYGDHPQVIDVQPGEPPASGSENP